MAFRKIQSILCGCILRNIIALSKWNKSAVRINWFF
jgi:hypothetical protein